MRADVELADACEAHSYPMPQAAGKRGSAAAAPTPGEAEPGVGDKPRPTPPQGPLSPRQLALLDAMGIDHADALEAWRAARRNGSDMAFELIVAGRITERRYGECYARELRLLFEPIRDDAALRGAAGFLGRPPPRTLEIYPHRVDGKFFVCPAIESIDRFARYLDRRPDMRAFLRVTAHSQIARAIERETMAQRYAAARLSLSADLPRLSARLAIEPLQAALGLGTTVAICLFLYYLPGFALAAGHGGATLFFAACLAIRVPAALAADRSPTVADLPAPGVLETGWQGVPVYSVLVALRQETTMVPQLVAALERLDWPKTRLDIKIVCEADDSETIAAVRQATAGLAHVSTVLVPPGEPRTKPKALNHALPLAYGEFLVLYDAEDVPDPGQLREAYLRFRTGRPELACLQAPLVVTNGETHWLSGLFALEYAALFSRMLPWLASQGFPLSLGGTSNHFVRERLVEVGGWDSHNVTEDADLGIRLHRAGYRAETITRPTYEQAPVRWKVWRNQRTRWMKGWFVTYLLHMRQPLLLFRQLGPRAMMAFQLVFFGMVVSAFAHPLFLLLVVIQLGAVAIGLAELDELSPFVVVDVFNVIAAYGLFIALSARGLEAGAATSLRRWYVLLPAYWALLAFASLRALWQLLIAPHKWEKTPHGLESRMNAGEPRHQIQPTVAG